MGSCSGGGSEGEVTANVSVTELRSITRVCDVLTLQPQSRLTLTPTPPGSGETHHSHQPCLYVRNKLARPKRGTQDCV